MDVGTHSFEPLVLDAKPASDALRNARLEVCASCSAFKEEHCTETGCPCTGAGIAKNHYSVCPRSAWPRNKGDRL